MIPLTVATRTILDRWKAMMIGTGILVLLFAAGMAVYRDLDLGLYDDLPVSLRRLMNIPAEADAATLAYGAIYGSYGAMTFAALTLAMGSAAIAGEERAGTLGLLLGNPTSRTGILLSKAAAMVLVAGAGAVVLWAGGRVVPALLDVDVTGLAIGGFVLHMYANALFYGFVALAVGAWTGRRSRAAGVAGIVMVVSFFGAGLLPLIGGVEHAAKLFPWYYFSGGDPLVGGLVWSHVTGLLAACAVLTGVAVVGVNRRDLTGPTGGSALFDRLRAGELVRRLAERRAGSTRVSRMWTKTVSDLRALTLATSTLMFLVMGVLLGPLYNLLDERLREVSAAFPDSVMALVGGGDMSTPEGFYQAETFGLMAPIAVMTVTIAVGARAVAGEEARGTIGMLLANPIPRARLVVEAARAMVVVAVLVGTATFAGVAGGSLLGGLGMDLAGIAGTVALVTLLGLVVGGIALVLGAATGRVRIATFGAASVAVVGHVANALFPLSERLAGLEVWTPNHYYLAGEPLQNGMQWGHGAVLASVAVALVVLAAELVERRDLRQA